MAESATQGMKRLKMNEQPSQAATRKPYAKSGMLSGTGVSQTSTITPPITPKEATQGAAKVEEGTLSEIPFEQRVRAQGAAFRELTRVVERYGPINRDKDVHTRYGLDLFNQALEDKPLSRTGVLVVAADLIKRWEAIVGGEYKKALDKWPAPRLGQQWTRDGAIRLLWEAMRRISDPHVREKQRPEDQQGKEPTKLNVHPTCHLDAWGKNCVVSRKYLEHLELENLAYRHHLHIFEGAAAAKLVDVVDGISKGRLGEDGLPLKQPAGAAAGAGAATTTGAAPGADPLKVSAAAIEGTKRKSELSQHGGNAKKQRVSDVEMKQTFGGG